MTAANTLTTTVTFADLIDHYADEIADLREAYDDTLAKIEDDFGEDAIHEAVPQNPDDEERAHLAALQQTANLFSESAKAIQKRQHVLEGLAEQWSGDRFEIRMLTGSELADIETELRMEAHREGVEVDTLQAKRQRMVADAATVEAPEEVPTDDEGSPTPSECPNPLTLSLYELIEEVNQSGGVDFTPPGFGDPIGTGSPSSATPTDAADLSSASVPDDDSIPASGESSNGS